MPDRSDHKPAMQAKISGVASLRLEARIRAAAAANSAIR